jgi:hypothetical protein
LFDKKSGKPTRYSELGLTPDGERRPFWRVHGYDSERLAPLLLEGDVVEPSEIVGLVQPLGFTPSGHEAEELARVLNILRVTEPKEEGFPEAPQLENLANALSAISDDAPRLIEILQESILTAGPNAVATAALHRLSWICDLRTLHAAAHRLRMSPYPFFRPPGQKTREAIWQRDAIWLWFICDGLARKHGKHISFTKDSGLGSELIHRALGRVGIAVEPSAVAKAISRFKKKPLPVIVLRDGSVG